MLLFLLSFSPSIFGLLLRLAVTLYSCSSVLRGIRTEVGDVSARNIRRGLLFDKAAFGLFNASRPLVISGITATTVVLLLVRLSVSAPIIKDGDDSFRSEIIVLDALRAITSGRVNGNDISEMIVFGLIAVVGQVVLFWPGLDRSILKLPNRKQLDCLAAAEDCYSLGVDEDGHLLIVGTESREQEIGDLELLALTQKQGPNAMLPSSRSTGTLLFEMPKRLQGERVPRTRAGRRDWRGYRLILSNGNDCCAAAIVGSSIAYFPEQSAKELARILTAPGSGG